VASNYAGSTDGGWLVFGEWQFTTAPEITQRLEAPAVKVPPPVLQEDGKINKEYFGVLAAEKGPYIMNKPPNFEHDYAADRIERCVKTQATAQTVHDSSHGVLDLKALQAYVGQKVTTSQSLPLIHDLCRNKMRSLTCFC
jgi:hypothetical protein